MLSQSIMTRGAPNKHSKFKIHFFLQ